ncbi:MAG: hypothetical protein ACI81Q_001251 [Paracoccaceae bacterium]|jgi:uncharacterized protein (TIGR00369 family)
MTDHGERTMLRADLREDLSAIQAHIGHEMTGWAKDWSQFQLPMHAHLMNRYGIPHGGIYAVLLDTVMGFSGCYTGDKDVIQLAMTLSMTTNFVGQPKGTILIAEGTRIGGGRRTFFAEGRVIDDTGTLIATGTGTFRYRAQAV